MTTNTVNKSNQLILRLKEYQEVHAYIVARAVKNGRSVNKEIIMIIKHLMSQENK